jgi:DMSO/TMAO reductase YedYZ molybdopterin-dependent catalytic subunit
MKKKNIALTLIATIIGLLLLTSVSSAQSDNEPNLVITNLSGTSYVFTYTQLFAMPKTIVNADLYCDGVLVTYGNWSGVLLSYLLTQTQASPEVVSIYFVASDGYSVAIPIDLAIQPHIIIAYEKDGQPLAEGLRLIIPDANGASWIAKITSIAMSTSEAYYPQAISVGNPQIVAPTQMPTTPTSPPKQQASVSPPPLTPENSSSIQEATPTNITQPSQPATNPQVSNESYNLQTISVYLIGIVCAISLITTAYIALSHKRKQLHHLPT